MAHIWVGVPEEEFVPLAQRIHIWFAPLRCCEAVLGTFATAEKVICAPFALHGQCFALVAPESLLFLRGIHFNKRRGEYVPQTVFGVDKVVARIYIAVVLYDRGIAAGLAEGT